ncbi:La ribonucleoprotein [Ancistrocladus abbreviatus]
MKKQRSIGGSSSQLFTSHFESLSHSQSQSPSQSPSRSFPAPNDDHETPLPRPPAGAIDHYQDEEEFEEAATVTELGVTEGEVGNGEEAESEEEERELEDEEGEEQEEEQGGEDEGEVGGGEEEQQEVEMGGKVQERERAKLAEGFYEIEAIRKRRIFKGEPQYLIKWRGWPESSNTWEPLEHLQTCPDVVEAFENSLHSGQKKASRKRKRKFTQSKKKLQYSYGGSRSKVSSTGLLCGDESQSSAHLNNLKAANLHPASLPSSTHHVVEHSGDVRKTKLARKANEDSSKNFHAASNDKNNGGNSYDENACTRKFSVQFQEPMCVEGDDPEICLSKADHKEPGQNDRCTGAKRRKSGSVRRFKQDPVSFTPNHTGNVTPTDVSSCDRLEQLVAGNIDNSKNNFDFSKNTSVVTRIIKPISYSTSISNNVQDVSVTFVVMRADGKEVMVDNKFLKANNPLLLINFYEQHLRYSPT